MRRLTVVSGTRSFREAAERLPASTTASSVDIASIRSIHDFHYSEGYVPILAASAA